MKSLLCLILLSTSIYSAELPVQNHNHALTGLLMVAGGMALAVKGSLDYDKVGRAPNITTEDKDRNETNKTVSICIIGGGGLLTLFGISFFNGD